tara:strand:- start:1484 stop:2347 length:864 start_codon:yes stop_codon:yes gene_type:complete
MTKARDLANVISGSGTLNANVIPNLPTSKITSGTFADARLSSSSVTQHVDLSNLNASNLTSGTVPNARITLDAAEIPDLPTSKITSGTFADARLAASNVTQHVDLSNLNASNLTSGSIPNARVASGAVTQHVSAVTNTTGTWTPSFSVGTISVANGARYQRVGDIVTVFMYIKTTSSIAFDTTVIYMNGLPITSRNTGNTHDLVGSGSIMALGSRGYRVGCVVKSNSTSMYFVSSYNQLRNLSDVQGLATAVYDWKDITHYAIRRNFYGGFSNSNDNHIMMFCSYLV